jgi:hypothetical protein
MDDGIKIPLTYIEQTKVQQSSRYLHKFIILQPKFTRQPHNLLAPLLIYSLYDLAESRS